MKYLLLFPIALLSLIPAAAAQDAVEAVEIETIEVAPPPQTDTDTLPDAARQEAQEKRAAEKPVIIEEEKPRAPAPRAEQADMDDVSEKPARNDAAAPRDVNYAALESAGTLATTRDGALGKSVWQNHKRSDIVLMLDRVPLRTEMASITALKKSALLSESDAGLIDNDILPKAGYDLLTKRLYLLMDSGLYQEAYDLYTQSVEDPYDESLARAGILLTLLHGGMGTACLEEKVLAVRFKGQDFWDILDAACNVEMSGKANADTLKKSSVINAIFTQDNYKVPAADHAQLLKMTRLERAMLLAQERIDYGAVLQDVKRGTSAEPLLLMLYLRDPALPPALLLPLQKEAIARGLLSPYVLKKSDPAFKRINEIENPAEQAQALKGVLADEPVLGAIVPYADLIRENKDLSLDSTLSLKALSVLVLAGGEIPAAFTDRLEKEAAAHPENYVYLQALSALGRADKSVNIPVDKLAAGANALGLKKSGQILAIIENLDKGKKLNDNPARVYEKQLGLTSDGYYVMPSLGLSEWLRASSSQQLTGLSVLITLTMLHDQPGTIYAGTLREGIEGLQAVGLIENANKVMEEILVSVINDNKGE